MILVFLLASFGITFGIQNKIPCLHVLADGGSGKARKLLKSLLSCPYCLGFWTGWLTWFAAWALTGHAILETAGQPSWLIHVVGGLVWAFASTVFCYFVYVSIVWLEDSLGK